MAGAEPADGAWLRRLRASAGLTQAQLAAQAAVGIRTVRDLERGGARPRASSLHRLAAALGVDAAQLDRLAHGGERVPRPPAAEGSEGAVAQVRVDVLGPLTVRRGSGTVPVSSAMQRTVLGLLAIQPGEVAAEAGAALARLADRNLLVERVPGRFQAHDLVRLYAAELVRTAESAAARAAALDRLTGHYTAGVSRAARLLYPHLLTVPHPDDGSAPGSAAQRHGVGPVLEDGRAALAWLDAERSGLVALTARLVETGAVLAALVLAEGLTGYFLLRADRVDWPTIARLSLQAAAVHDDASWLAMAWLQCGMATRAAADQHAASGHFTRSAKAARRAGWTAGEAVALNNLATSLWARGLIDEAVERFDEALALHRRCGRAAGEAVTLANLGAARLEQAREAGAGAGRTLLDEALNLLNQAWELHRGIGDRRNEAATVRLLAEVHRDNGDDVRALDLAREALRVAGESGDLLLESSAHSTLAALLARGGERERAFAEHGRALDLARRADAVRETAEALMDLADTHVLFGQSDDAVLAAGDAQAAAARANSVVLRRRADRVRARVTTGAGVGG